MAGIFPPADKNGAPPGGNVCNGFSPTNPVIGEGPLYVRADCATVLTDCNFNSIVSEILAFVDYLGVPYNANRINNMGTAIRDTVNHLNQRIDERVLRSGDTMTGELVLAGNPTTDLMAATKWYVDQVELAKVDRAGDQMTGPLRLPADPTDPMEATTKQYVDQHLGTLVQEAPDDAFTYGRRNLTWTTVLPTSGGAMTGALIVRSSPDQQSEAVSKGYVDAIVAGGSIDLSTFAPLVSPLFTGTPRGPTPPIPSAPADDTRLATVEFVREMGGGFTTGDVKLTFKNVADPGWVLMNDGYIGNTGANVGVGGQAGPEYETLFTLLWNNIPDAWVPVEGGRGASAAADWAADKWMRLPRVLGRALAGAGQGSGLTARGLGQSVGEESHVMIGGEMVAHNHGVGDPTHSHAASTPNYYNLAASYVSLDGGSTYNASMWNGVGSGVIVNNAATGIWIQNSGGSAPSNVMQPTIFLNIMIKL